MKNTVSTFLSMKQNGERLTEITSYDYTTASWWKKRASTLFWWAIRSA